MRSSERGMETKDYRSARGPNETPEPTPEMVARKRKELKEAQESRAK